MNNLILKNNLIEGTKEKKYLLTKLKQKNTLLKKVKHWTSIDEIKQIANAFMQGTLIYGLSLWAKENVNIIEKIEKIRVKIIRNIMGYNNTENLNRKQILNLFNWKTINEHKIIQDNIKIHKTFNTKQPLNNYIKYTNNRDQDQIKYYMIKTHLRSEESYNLIPTYVRMKNVKNCKLSYKRYRKDIINNPKILFNKNSIPRYTLIWPGG